MFPLFPGAAEAVEPPPEPSLTHLFGEQRLRSLLLRNRVVMPAMRTGFASRTGRPTPRLLAWYGFRAAGGVGLVIVEPALVHAPLPGERLVPPSLRLADDAAIPAFRRLAAAIHEGGALAAIQLDHIAAPDLGDVPRREIERAAEAFGAAARRACKAGFDAVQLQCAYGGLLARLLSRSTNKRADAYGRGPAGRLRAVREALAAVRAQVGADFPVLVKLGVETPAAQGAPGGAQLTPDQVVAIAQALSDEGAAAVEVVVGECPDAPAARLSGGVGEATFTEQAAAVKRAIAAPVIAGGRVLSSDAERVLREEKTDCIAVGRAILADPGWPAKLQADLELEVIPCISCLACFTPAPDGGTGCSVNGEAGREYLPPLPPADPPRRINVLGANLAALELARVAATRGHLVEITTAGLPLGGLLGLRAGVPGNAEFGRALLYFGDRLAELGVFVVDELRPNADVTIDCRPEPEIRPPWAKGKGLLTAGELLGRDLHELYGIGRRVAVAGQGALAAEVALFLAGWGRRPTVIVPGAADDPFPDVHPMHAARLLERLDGYKVPLVCDATPLEWRYDEDRKSQLRVRRRDSNRGGDGGSEEWLGPFHSAVAMGGWPNPAVQGPRAAAKRRKGALAPWPQAFKRPRLPIDVPSGSTITLGDTPYPEPLRDLVAFTHLLARRL